MNARVQRLNPEDILTVYSGKAGKCCCGCAGRHIANPQHLEEATKGRGYTYDAADVSAKQVTRVLRQIQAEDAEGDEGADLETGLASIVVGKRLYVAYFTDAYQAAREVELALVLADQFARWQLLLDLQQDGRPQDPTRVDCVAVEETDLYAALMRRCGGADAEMKGTPNPFWSAFRKALYAGYSELARAWFAGQLVRDGSTMIAVAS